jgi:hypothetical protein
MYATPLEEVEARQALGWLQSSAVPSQKYFAGSVSNVTGEQK